MRDLMIVHALDGAGRFKLKIYACYRMGVVDIFAGGLWDGVNIGCADGGGRLFNYKRRLIPRVVKVAHRLWEKAQFSFYRVGDGYVAAFIHRQNLGGDGDIGNIDIIAACIRTVRGDFVKFGIEILRTARFALIEDEARRVGVTAAREPFLAIDETLHLGPGTHASNGLGLVGSTAHTLNNLRDITAKDGFPAIGSYDDIARREISARNTRNS